MPDVMSTVNDLKSLPDQALQVELARPSGAVPAYLVLAEAQRRQTMRQAATADRNKQPVGSVYDDVIKDMMARQPPPGVAPAGATPPPSGPPAAPPTPQNFRPATGMAEGGEVDDEDGSDSDMVEMPRFNLQQAVADTARRHNLDPADLYGVVQTESGGDPKAVGPKTKHGQAAGLMQLMPDVARKYGVDDRMNPQQSLDGGASYLHDLYTMFGDWDLARAAYNAGPGNVQKYGGIPPFKETQNYIARADNFAQQFKGAQPGIVPIAEPDKPGPDDVPAAAAATKAVQSESPMAAETSGLASLDLANLPATSSRGFVLPPAYTAQPDNTPAPAPAAPVAARPPKDPYSSENLKNLYDAQNDMRALPVQQNDRERAIQNMIDQWYAEAQKRKKPTIWDYMANFGAGMASTPSRNWAQSIAGGVVGMGKGLAQQQEDARKQQLEAMGIDLKLDDQMRTQQQKQIDNAKDMAKTQETAYNQALVHDEAQKQRTMQELLKGRSEVQYQRVSDGVPPGYEVVTPDLLNPSMQYVAAPMRIKLDAVQHAKLLPFLPGYKPGDMVPYAEFKQAGIEAAKAALPKAPTAESQKLIYQTALGKLERERSAAGQPPINAADLPSVMTAIRTSKTLTDEEKQNAIAFAQANTTPASTGTTAATRAGAILSSRMVSLIDTRTGQAFSTNMADFNEMNAQEPGRYVQASVGMPVMNKESVYGDIIYNINHTRQAVQQLGSMNAKQRAELTAALQSTDPQNAVHTFITGTIGTSMTDQQKEAVIAIRQLMENAMMLRTLGAMGQGSDDLRHAIIDTLPGAKSPDVPYMLRQLDQFYQTVQRLHKGLPTLGNNPRAGETPTTPVTPTTPSTDDKNKKKKSLDEIFVKP